MIKSVLSMLMDIKMDVFKSLKKGSEAVQATENSDHWTTMNAVMDEPKNTVGEDLLIASPSPSALQIEMLIPETRYFEIKDKGQIKRMAYTISGNLHANRVLLCLPGLLETRASFLVLHTYFLKFAECKVISIDVSGRGDSDYIASHGEYTMSLYLSEISALIEQVILINQSPTTRISILGTSMGGVLAMYLTQIFTQKIAGIILNDIALTVNWSSLYSLYKSMKNEIGFKEVRDLARDLSVDERAITDVQRPGHFDLSYRADIWGMNFHEALEDFKGRMGLIYGGKSEICTKQRVEEAKTHLPSLQTFKVDEAGHPVPFNLEVCDFIQNQLGIA